jgi:hypothetical protein
LTATEVIRQLTALVVSRPWTRLLQYKRFHRVWVQESRMIARGEINTSVGDLTCDAAAVVLNATRPCGAPVHETKQSHKTSEYVE